MGPMMIVILAPTLYHIFCLGSTEEQFAIETLVPQLTVKTLDVTILPRAARLDEHGANPAATQVTLYSLIGFEQLSDNEINELIVMCKQRLQDYIKKRGIAIWSHRRKSSGYISGTLKYEVLKRAKFHCELCGISADVRALEVDHIIPRNLGGSDNANNLQTLCYKCNAMKRDRDDTDFRSIRESYLERKKDCLFCEINKAQFVIENELAFTIRDGFPVTEMHSLIIPKRHI